MDAVAYTVDGSAEPLKALLDAGDKVAIRNIAFFSEVEKFVVVGLEREDQRIREAYEAVGATVSILPSVNDVTLPPGFEVGGYVGGGDPTPNADGSFTAVLHQSESFIDKPADEKAVVPDVAPVDVTVTNSTGADVQAEITVTKAPEVVKAAPAKKPAKRK
ncbi:MAG: hypothetical protein Q7J45_00725 [bacterium]|nr:hypothetical protein [bacterium]